LERLDHDNIPEYGCHPWLVPGKSERLQWLKGPGPLGKFVGAIWDALRVVSDDFGRHIEAHFRGKLQPRNIFLSWVWDKKLQDMNFIPPPAQENFTPDDIIGYMLYDGLGRSPGMGSLYSTKPPSGTAMGVVWDSVTNSVIHGTKDDYWVTVLSKAKEAMDWIGKRAFSWDHIDEDWPELIAKFDAIYVPSVRLDRGFLKLRLIWAGNAVFYAMEQAVSHGIKEDMRASLHLGYRPDRGALYRDLCGNRPIITGDFAGFDLHQNQSHMKSCWQAWQILYRLPESLMCALYAYNVYGPIALRDAKTSEMRLQQRKGIASSGSGAFVIINNLYARSVILRAVTKLRHVSLERLHQSEAGLSFGDDHVVLSPCSHMGEWVSMMARCGQDAQDVEVNNGEFKFLRMLFGQGFDRVPITFSRFRNACCPEDPGIEHRDPYINAIALRAQLLPFLVMRQVSSGWKTVYEALAKPLVTANQLMVGVRDDDLSRYVGADASRELDALFFAKRYYMVKDTSLVL